jgi:AmmeMemoRadiSam system protein A
LQRALAPGWRLVPILVGRLDDADYRAAADLLRPLAGEDTLVVVSSDFTHFGPRFGFTPFPLDGETPSRIRALDEGAVERMIAGDAAGFLEYQSDTGVTICGYRPLALLLHLLPADAGIEPIAYATSGELTGDWLNSVSYVGMVVTGEIPFSGRPAEPEAGAAYGIGAADLRMLHRLAVLGVELAALGRTRSREAGIRELLETFPAHLREPAGAFVTLKRNGRLRGCIGYILPRKPLVEAVLENGVNAALNDRRFRPVGPDELGDLEVEVSVLSPPRSIASVDAFRVGEQGLILRKGGRQAVFLPEVAAEQGWTREDTLSHLARKAGLPDDGWRQGASFAVFTSTKYSAPYLSNTEAGGRAGEPAGVDARMPSVVSRQRGIDGPAAR